MASKLAFNAVNKLFRDFLNIDEPFGGLEVVLSGDFRQTLPIVGRGTRTSIIEDAVKGSAIWFNVVTLHLIDNVRLSENDDEFKNWLLDIGDGKFSDRNEELLDIINIPEDIVCVNNIVDEISEANPFDSIDDSINTKVVFTTTNADALGLNNKVLKKLIVEPRVYSSVDIATDANSVNLESTVPTELMNTLIH